MTQALGSPKTPRTEGCGRNPVNTYASVSRRFRFAEFAIAKSCTNSELIHMPQTKHWRGFQAN